MAGEELLDENVQPDRLVDGERLARYLAEQPALRDALPVLEIKRIGQGQSNLTYRVRLAGRTAILRRPPSGPLPPRAHDVLREYRVIQALSHSAVPVPQPLLACSDPAVLGAPFYLMENLPGDAIRFELPPGLAATAEARRSIGRQLVETLAKLHTLDPAAAGLASLGRPSGYVPRQISLFKKQLESFRTRPLPDLEWVTDWLEKNMPPDAARPTLVHGDYKLDNVIFSPEPPPRLLGVVDWELATLGDPLADLGWMLAFWCENGTPPPELTVLPRVTEQPGFPTRRELAEYYAHFTGQRLPDLRYYVVFALWKLAVVFEGHWSRHLGGTAAGFEFGYLEKGGPVFAAYIREIAQGRAI